MNRSFLLFLGCTGAMSGSLVSPPTLHAQTVTGAVVGNVVDASGAVIPGATVLVHNVDTGVDSPGTTDKSGQYRIANLPIGRYQVTISAPGFGEQTIPAFQLESVQTATFNVKLTPGSANTSVDVSSAPPILNTTDATLSSTFSSNTISNFPLNGLDFSAITLYVPGAVNTSGTAGTTSIERSTYNTDSVNLNGNRAQSNNYTLDGIDLNETFNNLIAYSPSPFALQEITVLTASSPADYGNVNGAGVVSVLKSGTNQFHGSAFGYVQDWRFNANSWTNKHTPSRSDIIPLSNAPYSQDQFGGTFGGPIRRNKLFFFVDYLGSRYHSGGTTFASVLTPAMRSGDFSALLAQASPIQLYDTQNGFAPYAGNKGVAINNPVAKYLFAHPELYPLPNATATDGLTQNDYQGGYRQYNANNQGDVKIEYDPSATDKLTGFYSMGTGYDGRTNPLIVSFAGTTVYPTKLFGVTWVHVFTPNLVNTARVGFTRTIWKSNQPQDTSGKFGYSGNSVVGIPFGAQLYQGFSYQSMGTPSVGTPAFGGGLTDNTYSYIDDVSWQHGQHTIKVGVQALRYQNNYPTANNNGFLGQFNYSGNFTSNSVINIPGTTTAEPGYGPADFLLDRVSGVAVTLGSVNVGQRQWRVAGYFSDSYKPTARLTLTAGIRYEIDQPWVESNNKTGNIDLATGQIQYAHAVPTGAAAGAGVCSNRACYDYNFHQAMPKLGFAYQVSNSLVLRGGYGATSFFEGNSSNQRLTSITPFIQAVNVTVQQPKPGAVSAPRTVEQGFTGSLAYGGTYNAYPKNIQPAYVQQWNLVTEYALTHSTSLTVGYLGEQGQHIEDYGNVNQWKIAGDATSAPFYNNPYIGSKADPSIAVGSSGLLITESRAMMNYNALQATLRQRASFGLEYTINYTYAKAMTNSLGNYTLNTSGFSGAFQNYYDSAADYGPAGYDVRHNVSATGVYALPVGHNKAFLANSNYLVDELLGGWKLSLAAIVYSGLPESVTGNNSNSVQSYGNSRPDYKAQLHVVNRTVDQWYGSAYANAFGSPAGTFGTARVGSLRGPAYQNVDISAFKDFRTFREQTVGFRFDAFNAFNLTSLGNPDSNFSDTNFGQISNTRSVERHLQFNVNYKF
jgi:hypothetical protein